MLGDDEVKRWALNWGAGPHVLEPPALRAAMLQEAKKFMAVHGGRGVEGAEAAIKMVPKKKKNAARAVANLKNGTFLQ